MLSQQIQSRALEKLYAYTSVHIEANHLSVSFYLDKSSSLSQSFPLTLQCPSELSKTIWRVILGQSVAGRGRLSIDYFSLKYYRSVKGSRKWERLRWCWP